MIADPHKQQIPPLCCATVGMTYFRTPGCIEITRTGKSKGKSRSPFGDDNKKGKSNTRTWLRDGIASHPSQKRDGWGTRSVLLRGRKTTATAIATANPPGTRSAVPDGPLDLMDSFH